MNIKKYLVTFAALVGLMVGSAHAEHVAVSTDKNSVILKGYDTVAYFTKNAAVEGSSEFTAVYDNAIYYFSSAKNRKLFNADPAKYAPQYGGFCAYGAAIGKKFDVNGKAFEIVDGKLYVNKNKAVYKRWAEDKAEYIKEGDTQWAEIKTVKASKL